MPRRGITEGWAGVWGLGIVGVEEGEGLYISRGGGWHWADGLSSERGSFFGTLDLGGEIQRCIFQGTCLVPMGVVGEMLMG
jgi:hypothetical protein